MTEIKDVKATGEWIILEAKKAEEKETTTSSGLILPGKKANGQSVNTGAGKDVVDLYVYDIGPDAKEKVSYKTGDMVIVDNYDMQCFGDENKLFGICHFTKVKAVIEN